MIDAQRDCQPQVLDVREGRSERPKMKKPVVLGDRAGAANAKRAQSTVDHVRIVHQEHAPRWIQR